MFLEDYIAETPNHPDTIHIYYTRNQISNRIYHSIHKYSNFYKWNYHLYKAEESKRKIDIVHIGPDAVLFENAKIIEIQEVIL